MRTVLVTGASGSLGPEVVKALLASGHRVRTYARSAPRTDGFGAALDVRQGDIEDTEAVADAMAGVDVVVHMAALLHVVAPPPCLEREYDRVNVGGTRVVVEAATRVGVSRVVYVSTIAVYGDGSPDQADEHTVPAPDSPYALSKLRAEEIVLGETGIGKGTEGTVLRLAAVYGSHVKGNYLSLVRALARRRFIPVGPGRNRRTLVHESDAARAVVLASTHRDAAGRLFNVTDGSTHTVASITASICRALGRRPPGWSIPVRVAAGIVRTAELPYRLLGRRPPVSRRTLEKYLEDVAVSGEAIRRQLGFAPALDLDDGWREAVDGMRRDGRL